MQDMTCCVVELTSAMDFTNFGGKVPCIFIHVLNLRVKRLNTPASAGLDSTKWNMPHINVLGSMSIPLGYSAQACIYIYIYIYICRPNDILHENQHVIRVYTSRC